MQTQPNPPKILLLLQDSGKTLQQVEKDLNFYHLVEVKKWLKAIGQDYKIIQ